MTRFHELADWREPQALLAVPPRRGILLVELAEGAPYIGRTANLRKRLRRLLAFKLAPSSRLTLRDVAKSVHFRTTGSSFESDLALYGVLRRHRPRSYREILKLRPAFFVKLLLGNRFPRVCLSRRLARSRALFYGPFPNRGAAERFRDAFLDLFLVRRCTENLDPSPDHPGCIWGEMNLCLRPCQAACDDSQYAREVERMATFLATDGESVLGEAAAARERASAGLEFEAAARHHRRWGKAREALRLRGDLAREISMQCGMVLQQSAQDSCIELTPLHMGSLQSSVRLRHGSEPSRADLGRAIKSALADRDWRVAPPRAREEHLALLQRWHASSFRTGRFVRFEGPGELPLRRLANAAFHVATAGCLKSQRQRGARITRRPAQSSSGTTTNSG